MYMIFNAPKGWILALLYDDPAIPEKLQLGLNNMESVTIRNLANWFTVHKVRARALCVGGWQEKLATFRFRSRFNRAMKRKGMLADFRDICREITKES